MCGFLGRAWLRWSRSGVRSGFRKWIYLLPLHHALFLLGWVIRLAWLKALTAVPDGGVAVFLPLVLVVSTDILFLDRRQMALLELRWIERIVKRCRMALDWSKMTLRFTFWSRKPFGYCPDSSEPDRCPANVEMVGKDELWYGQFGRLIVVPAETPFRTNAGQSGTRLGQSDRYSWMDEPRLNCSERPDLHVELVPCTDPWTGAHQVSYQTCQPRLLSSVAAHAEAASFRGVI
ncbi:hypothetical protein F2Q68_00043131 [Brassica cretica]|uniref:Uncharacterized protein n=1 Tax=Brassica cretica TaxID=69181 RepID=A0A8S9LMM7_BRACR|nr:hypothetical protein F2Q68_00043131 [Brassica cretica]